MERAWRFLLSRRKYCFYSTVFFSLFLAFFSLTSKRWGIAVTAEGQQCFPQKYWLIEKSVRPVVGEYVAFRGRGIPYFRDDTQWVKMIAGEKGYRVEAREIGFKERAENPGAYQEEVVINGGKKTLSIRGYVSLYNRDGSLVKELKAYAHDSKGRPLPMITSQEIPEGKYFVMATDKRSYDSRYWGLIDESWITGRAHPVY